MDQGLVIMQRLHRMVRHGYRPLLGHDVASGQDREIQLLYKRSSAAILADGAVRFGDGRAIGGGDAAAFDATFPPNAPNKRNVMRRLYEMGF